MLPWTVDDIIRADVLDFAPELATGTRATTDGAWVRILAYVNAIDMTGLFENEQDTQLARVYLAAHVAKVTSAASGTTAGPVTSESVGGVRRAYANTFSAAAAEGTLGTTRYGQMYREILGRSLASGPFLV